MSSHFFAILSRMKNIHRWGLMRNTRQENLCEHSFEVALLAHALATLRNKAGGSVNPEQVALYALFHDATEILTGDMPTPVKYYSPTIASAYKEVEAVAGQRLLSLLPQELQDDYAPLLLQEERADQETQRLVKAADKLSALIKCVEERAMGNKEFSQAEKTITASLHQMELPEVELFMEQFLPSYSLTLDEQETKDTQL